MTLQLNYAEMEAEEKPFADRLAIFIKDIINPKIVLDIGCGPGHFVYSMRDVGIEAYGIDTDERILNKKYLTNQSLFSYNKVVDTAICLEVAEHLPFEISETLVASINNMFTDTLIFTAAQPGQGGIGHINCQLPEFWSNKFVALGCKRNFLMENLLRLYCKQGMYMGWFYNNVMVFNK